MGYTHYWYRPARLDAKKFKQAAQDCKRVCEALNIPLGNGSGKGEPEFSNQAVWFNGAVNSKALMSVQAVPGLLWPAHQADGLAEVGNPEPEQGAWWGGPEVNARCLDENGDGSYETFNVDRVFEKMYPQQTARPEGWVAFCKTNFRPYDLDVQCCLIVFKEHFGEPFVVHSDGNDEQWNEARSVCQHVLGYGLLFELSKN